MILTPHAVLGAAIGSKIAYLPLAIVLALASHYLLDLIPHADYPIDNFREKKWRKAKFEILSMIADSLLGLVLVFSIWQLSSANFLHILIPAFFGVAPDFLSFLFFLYPKNKFLKWHSNLHKKLHFLENKKFSINWRIISQILIILLSFLLILL